MKSFFLMMALAMGLSAQSVVKVLEFEPDGTDQAERLGQLLRQWGTVSVFVDPVPKLVLLRGPKADVDEAELAFRKYYKPKAKTGSVMSVGPANVELVMHVLLGKPGAQEGPEGPAELKPVLTQLRASSGLGSFRVIESASFRMREKEQLQVTGSLNWPGESEGRAVSYQLNLKQVLVDRLASGNVIHLDGFRYGSRVPYKNANGNWESYDTGITTAVDLKEGQRVVVGKSYASAQAGSMILVLSARVVE
jgi:hypothetical protein